ncbi:MAG: hypothetical protein GY940_42760 [bacterium]|nr:hypothetical protein [bacterium]
MVCQDEAGFKIAVRNLSETGKNRPTGVLLLIIGAETIVFAVEMGENPVPPVHEDVAFLLEDVKAGPDAPGYVRAATESRNALHLSLHASHLLLHASHPATGAMASALHASHPAIGVGASALHALHLSRNASHSATGAGASALHALHLSRNALHPATGAGTQTLHAFPSSTNAGTEYLNEA